ncbi:hypothetical protein B0H14DRAFT_3053931 [Mycena olivaceomarginata]|nr:hypothetical protein B0H14DRAFT_3053931 [Mycena olivaceomarginata]
MFSNSTGLRFDQSHFYNVAGDMVINDHHWQHLPIQDRDPPMPLALGEGRAKGSSRGLVGAARNQRRTLRTPYARSRPVAGISHFSSRPSSAQPEHDIHLAYQDYPGSTDIDDLLDPTGSGQNHPASPSRGILHEPPNPLAVWTCRSGEIRNYADVISALEGRRTSRGNLLLQTRSIGYRETHGWPISRPDRSGIPILERLSTSNFPHRWLDECEHHSVQLEILRILGSAALGRLLRFKVLIASRPESHIREAFQEPSLHGLYQSTNVEQSFEDVQTYLRDEFSRIHREHRHTMGEIPLPWPSADQLRTLVESSSGYFIYAATIIKFIDDRDFRPTERLMAIVQNVPGDLARDRPFQALDQLAPARSRFLPILCAIIWFTLCLGDIEQLLALRRLHSVLQVPSHDSHNISVYHASFRDFLGDPLRSGEFCVVTEDRHMELARSVLNALSYMHDDPPLRRPPSSSIHVGWRLGRAGIDYVTAHIPPSAAILPLIGSVNLEFPLHTRDYAVVRGMVDWLKRIEPITASEDIIRRWETYWAMLALNMEPRPKDVFLERIIAALWTCRNACSVFTKEPPSLLHIRLLLEIPWSDMDRTMSDAPRNCVVLFRPTAPCPILCRDLVRGYIRLLKSINVGEMPQQFWIRGVQWGLLLKWCPDYLKLLRDLRGFRPNPSFLSPGLYEPVHIENLRGTSLPSLKLNTDVIRSRDFVLDRES